jgi:WSTF/HB1/Itc1p/MBD9 motif protein
MERIAQVFPSFDAADQADDQFYADLTPQERIELLLELVERYRSTLGASAERLERVHRVVELSQG